MSSSAVVGPSGLIDTVARLSQSLEFRTVGDQKRELAIRVRQKEELRTCGAALIVARLTDRFLVVGAVIPVPAATRRRANLLLPSLRTCTHVLRELPGLIGRGSRLLKMRMQRWTDAVEKIRHICYDQTQGHHFYIVVAPYTRSHTAGKAFR
jgi:hypothetical protein